MNVFWDWIARLMMEFGNRSDSNINKGSITEVEALCDACWVLKDSNYAMLINSRNVGNISHWEVKFMQLQLTLKKMY